MATVLLATERLLVRAWREQDELPLMRLLMDADFMQFSPSGALSEVAARARFRQLKQQVEHNPYQSKLALELVETRELIGYCGLEGWSLQGAPVLELGFRLIASARGKGYAEEAASNLLKSYASKGLTSIYAFTDTNNHPSIKLLQKLGFVQISAPQSDPLPINIFHRQN